MANTESGAVSAEELLVSLSIESWRFAKLFQKSIDVRDLKVAGRQTSQVRYFLKKIDDGLGPLGFSLVDLEGHPFDAGMAAVALNAADFGPEDHLVVDQMMEPIVMGRDGVHRQGTMMLRK